jgi:hypothetical protein
VDRLFLPSQLRTSVTEPIFWLALSLFLVAACLAAVLVAAIPVLQELARASRSAEKLFDTLYRELPPTLEAIRLTGLEISELTEDLNEGVESAGSIAKQFDHGLRSAQRQVQDVGTTTQSVFVGVQAAWKSLMRSTPSQFVTPHEEDHRRDLLGSENGSREVQRHLQTGLASEVAAVELDLSVGQADTETFSE